MPTAVPDCEIALAIRKVVKVALPVVGLKEGLAALRSRISSILLSPEVTVIEPVEWLIAAIEALAMFTLLESCSMIALVTTPVAVVIFPPLLTPNLLTPLFWRSMKLPENEAGVLTPMYVPFADGEASVEVPIKKAGLVETIGNVRGEIVKRPVGVVVAIPTLELMAIKMVEVPLTAVPSAA